MMMMITSRRTRTLVEHRSTHFTSWSHLTGSVPCWDTDLRLRVTRGAPGLTTLRGTSVGSRASHYTGGPPRHWPRYYKTRRLSPSLRDVVVDVTSPLIGASLLWRHRPSPTPAERNITVRRGSPPPSTHPPTNSCVGFIITVLGGFGFGTVSCRLLFFSDYCYNSRL